MWKTKLEYEQTYKNIKDKKFKEINIEDTIRDIERMVASLVKSKA